MKNFLAIFFLLSIIFSGCGNLESTSTATTAIKTPTAIPAKSTSILSLVDTAEMVQILPQEYMEEIKRYPELVSSDGEKIALANTNMDFHEESFFTFPIVSTNGLSPINNVEIQLDRGSSLYIFQSWSPDRTALAATYYDVKKYNGAETCCGEAIAITNIVDGKAKTFIYRWDWNEGSSISWSGDSTKISIDFPIEHNTLIIDRYGELLQTLDKDVKTVFWEGNLLYVTMKKDNKKGLYTLDTDTQSLSLILDDLGEFVPVAFNKKLDQFLLTKYMPTQNDPTTFQYSHINKFYIFDINTKLIKEIEVPYSKDIWLTHHISSSTQDYVALKGEDNSLWVFNWNIHELKYYGQIKNLLGWFLNADGFLVTSLDDEQKNIKP